MPKISICLDTRVEHSDSWHVDTLAQCQLCIYRYLWCVCNAVKLVAATHRSKIATCKKYLSHSIMCNYSITSTTNTILRMQTVFLVKNISNWILLNHLYNNPSYSLISIFFFLLFCSFSKVGLQQLLLYFDTTKRKQAPERKGNER